MACKGFGCSHTRRMCGTRLCLSSSQISYPQRHCALPLQKAEDAFSPFPGPDNKGPLQNEAIKTSEVWSPKGFPNLAVCFKLCRSRSCKLSIACMHMHSFDHTMRGIIQIAATHFIFIIFRHVLLLLAPFILCHHDNISMIPFQHFRVSFQPWRCSKTDGLPIKRKRSKHIVIAQYRFIAHVPCHLSHQFIVLSAAKRPAPNGPASLHARFRTHCQIPLDKKLSAAFSSSSRKRA